MPTTTFIPTLTPRSDRKILQMKGLEPGLRQVKCEAGGIGSKPVRHRADLLRRLTRADTRPASLEESTPRLIGTSEALDTILKLLSLNMIRKRSADFDQRLIRGKPVASLQHSKRC